MITDVQYGDKGTKITITVLHGTEIVDISSSLEKYIYLKPKNGTTITKTASFETDGTDGKMYAITDEDDFASTGEMSIQGRVVFVNGDWRTTIKTIRINKNL